jgi:hypothetical protein
MDGPGWVGAFHAPAAQAPLRRLAPSLVTKFLGGSQQFGLFVPFGFVDGQIAKVPQIFFLLKTKWICKECF